MANRMWHCSGTTKPALGSEGFVSRASRCRRPVHGKAANCRNPAPFHNHRQTSADTEWNPIEPLASGMPRASHIRDARQWRRRRRPALRSVRHFAVRRSQWSAARLDEFTDGARAHDMRDDVLAGDLVYGDLHVDFAPMHHGDGIGATEYMLKVMADHKYGQAWSRRRPMIVNTRSVSSTPRAAVGSSMMISRASEWIALPMATACRCPPDITNAFA